jgi:hypothetical protein
LTCPCQGIVDALRSWKCVEARLRPLHQICKIVSDSVPIVYDCPCQGIVDALRSWKCVEARLRPLHQICKIVSDSVPIVDLSL